ncbi:MAG: glycosyltransferase involved in cell wall biosynthesis [Clostridium sp.]|jgi:glycosyltransferase involved in cell wall biosynthesis
MKIAISTVQVPFIWGGAEFLAENLKVALEKAGHEAAIVTMPFKWYPHEKITEHILAARLLDLSESCGNKVDLCIGLKFPAYYIQNPNKVMWILHQHRQAYELCDTKYSDLNLSQTGLEVKRAIINADNTYIREARKVTTISKNVSNRLEKFNNINSIPLYHPCPGYENLHCEDYEDYILFPSRLTDIKRQHLAIEAMRYVKSDIKLYIVGSADMSTYKDELEKLVMKYKLQTKVKFFNFVSQKEKYKLFAKARGVIFIPYDEDYGYITMETMYSKKPLITCTDSGGPSEFIDNEVSGMIVEPKAIKLAEQIDRLGMSSSLAKMMGESAFKKIQNMNISWENVVKELTTV